MFFRSALILGGLLLVSLVGCGTREGGGADPTIVHDLTTPEGAILCLEDAYRAEDIEAAVRCKDFQVEAKWMLDSIRAGMADDKEVLDQAAEVLELAFRAQIQEEGFPDFQGIISSFPTKVPYQDREDMVQITETCENPGGQSVTNVLVVAKTDAGWKVVTLVD